MRKTIFAVGEYYHIYNRGVDKRDIVLDLFDQERFLESMVEFNRLEPIGSIYENRFREKQLGGLASKLVDIVAYSINPNHFHFILTPKCEKGIEKFMHRLGGGYTMYFNKKYKRSGSLFQGVYKSIHVDSNEYLLQLSAYINANNVVHGYEKDVLYISSMNEYKNIFGDMCSKEIVLSQFKSSDDYWEYAVSSTQYTFTEREKNYLEA